VNVWKAIPAVLAGNTVILRPSLLTPLSALVFGEAAEAAGVPPGVLNVVVESSTDRATMMTSHPAGDRVSFTGSTAVGRQILNHGADTIKRVMLELGGKSVQLYLADSMHLVAFGGVIVCAGTSGQSRVAPTRMLVPQDRKAEVLEASAEKVRALRVGDPSDSVP